MRVLHFAVQGLAVEHTSTICSSSCRKFVTSISGLESFEIKLKEAASALGKKFGSGATVSKTATGGQEIDIQGDLTGELPDMLVSLFGIPEAAIIVRD